MPRQRCDAVIDIVGAARCDRRQRRKIARQRIGPKGFALDETAVAVTGLATRRFAVHQHDRPAAALQMQRRSNPNNSGAENDGARIAAITFAYVRDRSGRVLHQPISASIYTRSRRGSRRGEAYLKGRIDDPALF